MDSLPDAGELNRRILIRLWSDVPNVAFGLDPAFDTGISRWAKVEPIHGIATRYAMQTTDSPTHLFWVRFGQGTKPNDITVSHVIEWSSRRYRVLDCIDVNGAKRFIRIATKELGPL